MDVKLSDLIHRAFGDDLNEMLAWLNSPNSEFNRRTPWELINSNQESVIRAFLESKESE